MVNKEVQLGGRIRMQVTTKRMEAEHAKIILQETAGLAIITIHRPPVKKCFNGEYVG